MNPESCNVIIAAEAPEALTLVCGISILERLLRVLQRLGVMSATIISATPDLIREHVAQPSWARAGLTVEVRARHGPVLVLDDLVDVIGSPSSNKTLVLTAAYYDSRSVQALLTQTETTLLVDSAPPVRVLPLLQEPNATGHICKAAVIEADWLSRAVSDAPLLDQLTAPANRREVAVIDLADQPAYVASMRRSIRPIWFRSPSASNIPLAERLVLDAAQNGTLDVPAIVHAPIETCIIARLCRTPITPNQITLFTACVSALVIGLFASGWLVGGTLLALGVGILDGLDGKQARVKVETTPLGQREHALDYLLELSWWSALAFHFAAYPWLLLLVASDLIDRLAKKQAKTKTGRNLDDVAPIDRLVRLIGGRRNIYIWIFGAGLLLHAADKAFVGLCCWGAATAAVHVLRVAWLCWGSSKRAPH